MLLDFCIFTEVTPIRGCCFFSSEPLFCYSFRRFAFALSSSVFGVLRVVSAGCCLSKQFTFIGCLCCFEFLWVVTEHLNSDTLWIFLLDTLLIGEQPSFSVDYLPSLWPFWHDMPMACMVVDPNSVSEISEAIFKPESLYASMSWCAIISEALLLILSLLAFSVNYWLFTRETDSLLSNCIYKSWQFMLYWRMRQAYYCFSSRSFTNLTSLRSGDGDRLLYLKLVGG